MDHFQKTGKQTHWHTCSEPSCTDNNRALCLVLLYNDDRQTKTDPGAFLLPRCGIACRHPPHPSVQELSSGHHHCLPHSQWGDISAQQCPSVSGKQWWVSPGTDQTIHTMHLVSSAAREADSEWGPVSAMQTCAACAWVVQRCRETVLRQPACDLWWWAQCGDLQAHSKLNW